MTNKFKPMKPDNKDWVPANVEANLPLLGFTKVDGIRTAINDGVALSNSLKPLPNKQLQAFVQEYAHKLQGWDMEVGVGPMTDEFFFKKSHGFCMKADREADFHLYVFDKWDIPTTPYVERIGLLEQLQMEFQIPRVTILPFRVLPTMDEVDSFVEDLLEEGHEGAIYRRPDRPYKYGRATPKCGGMYKRKSRVDTEVTIVGFNELMINNNPKATNELGRTQRSTHQENLVPGGTLGSIDVEGFFEDGRPFACRIGVFSGFTKEDLQNIWDKRDRFAGELMKIKYMGVGSDQAPRTPVALGFRNKIDMS